MLKSLHSLGSCAENFLLIQISSILSVIFTRLWLKCQRMFWWASCISARHAGWELWLSDDQPHSDYNGQWQRALCILAVLQSSQPNPQRNEKKIRKMYAIKQIKICAEYRDICYPGLGWICQVHLGFGLSASAQVPDKPALIGLGSMSRYFAQILICILRSPGAKIVPLATENGSKSNPWQ